MKTPDEKLTLKLKGDSISRAKIVAKKRGTSVSRMVEEYFDVTAPPPKPPKVSHLNELIAMMKKPMSKNPKDRAERAEYLWRKVGYLIVVPDDSWVTSGQIPIVSAKDALRALRRRF